MLATSKDDDKLLKKTFSIESLRCFAYFFALLMTVVGHVVTKYHPNFPPLPDGSVGSIENTFIVKMFHFPHSCVFIDFHPSKMIAAIIAQFFLYPMVAFEILNFYRVKYSHKQGEITNALMTFTNITTPINITATVMFVLVFVNNPEDKNRNFFGFPEDVSAFWYHYIPFGFYQLALVFIAIGQVWYLSLLNKMPFNIPAKVGWYYCIFMILLFTFYEVFIISFLVDHPIMDTTQPIQHFIAKRLIMPGFAAMALLIPFLCGLYDMNNGLKNTIEFS